ncbi:MAG TPA: LysM peptidoglycan-binding domain-containing protein [Gemmatimonadaceae bacterium]|nr:LysM peptidoglycan-binding domain-containing protein [Gemmatimonadaceae bacterium]
MRRTSPRALLSASALSLLLAACHPARVAPTPTPTPSPAPPASQTEASAAPADSGSAPVDVAREAGRIFGDSAVVADSAAADEPSWDIDVHSYEAHERVEYFLSRMTGPVSGSFTQWLARGGRYEPMIRSKLRAAGLPEDLTYLALIESGYDVHAYSRAAAVGIWQLMSSTARGVGLRVDWWVDERRDPLRSTDGAIKFLGWLNEQFGSLYLAAAAYNGGPGRISRGLSRYADSLDGATGNDAFFALAEKDYLRAETKDYVPKLIAAALVAKDPSRYGLKVQYLPPFEYDTVRVGASTPLAAVAKAANATLGEVKELNPHVLRGVTPPGGSFVVRVPVGKAEGFREAYLALPESDRVAFRRVTTKKGETRASLARRYDLTVRQLSWYNRGLRVSNKTGRVVPGQQLLVPSAGVVAGALDIPDPSLEIYGSGARRGATVTHVVRRGESLGSIAKKYGTTVESLKKLNRLKKTIIFPGQEILVSRGKAAPPARSASREKPASTKRESARVASSSKRAERGCGDCVSLSTAARMPAAGSSGAKAPRASAKSGAPAVHVVQRGETLTSIARKYDTTIAALKELNGLRDSGIRAGQKLRVKG